MVTSKKGWLLSSCRSARCRRQRFDRAPRRTGSVFSVVACSRRNPSVSKQARCRHSRSALTKLRPIRSVGPDGPFFAPFLWPSASMVAWSALAPPRRDRGCRQLRPAEKLLGPLQQHVDMGPDSDPLRHHFGFPRKFIPNALVLRSGYHLDTRERSWAPYRRRRSDCSDLIASGQVMRCHAPARRVSWPVPQRLLRASMGGPDRSVCGSSDLAGVRSADRQRGWPRPSRRGGSVRSILDRSRRAASTERSTGRYAEAGWLNSPCARAARLPPAAWTAQGGAPRANHAICGSGGARSSRRLKARPLVLPAPYDFEWGGRPSLAREFVSRS